MDWIYETQTNTHFWDGIDILFKWALKELQPLTLQEISHQSVKFFGHSIGAIADGIEQQCKDFLDKEESVAVYSGKSKANTLIKLVFVTPRKSIVYFRQFSRCSCGFNTFSHASK
jgi:hypothetical protein